MKYKISIIAGLGTPEIILILIAGLLFFAFLGFILFLVQVTMKRQDAKQQAHLPPNMAITISSPTVVAKEKNDTLQKDNSVGNRQNEKIALPQQHEIRYVPVNEIMRCEADDNYTNFYLTGAEKILISKSLKEYSDLLMPQGFLRTHQSHLVNPTFVKSWLKEDGGVLLMNNGDKIPVSKPNRESVKLMLGK